MTDTKERILESALRLFARDGYEAVSVSMIAGELGMTKAALYKHYKSKRDIFDSIVERMYRTDAERSRQFGVPEESFDTLPGSYCGVSWESLAAFTLAQYDFWTQDAFASNFRRMLTLEQYRSEEMARLYRSCLVEGPVEYTESIFAEMAAKGRLCGGEPRQLALEFYAPMLLLISVSDLAGESQRDALRRHVESFVRRCSPTEN